jgi:hypothetical protein
MVLLSSVGQYHASRLSFEITILLFGMNFWLLLLISNQLEMLEGYLTVELDLILESVHYVFHVNWISQIFQFTTSVNSHFMQSGNSWFKLVSKLWENLTISKSEYVLVVRFVQSKVPGANKKPRSERVWIAFRAEMAHDSLLTREIPLTTEISFVASWVLIWSCAMNFNQFHDSTCVSISPGVFRHFAIDSGVQKKNRNDPSTYRWISEEIFTESAESKSSRMGIGRKLFFATPNPWNFFQFFFHCHLPRIWLIRLIIPMFI